MPSLAHEGQTLSLIDAIPENGNLHDLQIPTECPLAADASGTQVRYYEAVALSPITAQALLEGRAAIDWGERKRLAEEVRFPDSVRIGEYAGCLLKRALGQCLIYDRALKRERTESEITELLNTEWSAHA